jgi:hypothetical protein
VAHIGSGNFIHYFGQTTTATEPISALNLEILQPRFARLAIELDAWEPVNDNDDPLATDPAAFVDDAHNHATFELMQQLQAQGVELTASIWRVPAWLVENPNNGSAQIIPRERYPEAIEAIAAWLLHAQETYGVEVAYFSFNEANIGINVLLSPTDYAEMIRLGGKRFAELGLNTRWLLADCSSIGGCLEYAQGIYANDDIRPYLGPLAFHNWDGVNVADGTITRLSQWAAENGLEARCTEGGWDAQLWRRSKEFPGWQNARRLAYSYTRVLKMSRATTFYYWEMMGGDYALNDGNTPYPALEMLRQMDAAFPPGTQIVGSSRDTSNIVFAAGMRPDGGFSLYIVNNGIAENVRFSGLPDGAYTMTIHSEAALNQPGETLTTADGVLAFQLPKFSVVVLLK